MRARLIVDRLARCWQRSRYRRTLNTPYLSGDFFRSLCDASLDDDSGTRRRFRAALRTARSLFVKTDCLAEFLADHSRHASTCRVLVTGNSDLEILEVPAGLPPQVRTWFAQNALVRSDLVQPLPIGLENQSLGQNGVRRHFRRCTEAEVAAKRVRILASFAITTPERVNLLERLASSPRVDVFDRVSPHRFQERIREYRFVAAPRGNGVDTHRLWEALYADAIPITRRTCWSESLRAEGIPTLEIDDWEEVVSWTTDDLARFSEAAPRRPSALPWLWADFWEQRIARLREAGP